MTIVVRLHKQSYQLQKDNAMITSGGIQNTHYNLIDTLHQFMGAEWRRCYEIVADYIRKNCDPKTFLECIGPCPYPFIDQGFIMQLAELDCFIKEINYTAPIRYTIVEAIVWQYINTELKEF